MVTTWFMNECAQGARTGDATSTCVEVRMGSESSLVAAVAFIFASQQVVSLPPRTIQNGRQNLRVYRHNAIVVLTMNNAIVLSR